MTRPCDLPLVYVAGPYTHPDPVENTHKACEVASAIMDTGLAAVLLPHPALVWHLVTPRPLDFWYELDLAHLARCDAVFRFEGASTGADAEVAFAVERGIPVFTEGARLIAWLHEQKASRGQ